MGCSGPIVSGDGASSAGGLRLEEVFGGWCGCCEAVAGTGTVSPDTMAICKDSTTCLNEGRCHGKSDSLIGNVCPSPFSLSRCFHSCGMAGRPGCCILGLGSPVMLVDETLEGLNCGRGKDEKDELDLKPASNAISLSRGWRFQFLLPALVPERLPRLKSNHCIVDEDSFGLKGTGVSGRPPPSPPFLLRLPPLRKLRRLETLNSPRGLPGR